MPLLYIRILYIETKSTITSCVTFKLLYRADISNLEGDNLGDWK